MKKRRATSGARTIAPPLQSAGMEGIVAFGSDSFRYRLCLDNETLNIWLQNCKSEKQWESGKLSLDAIVHAGEAIPSAEIANYATSFHKALETSTNEQFQQERHAFRGDQLRLDLTLKFTMFESFALTPIASQNADTLESKVQALEAKLTKLEDRIDKPSAKPIYLYTTSINTPKKNGLVKWGGASGKSFKIYPSGAIEILVDGVYMINVVLHHSNSSADGEAFCVMKGNDIVGFCFDAYDDNSLILSTPLMVILELKAGDKISVVYKGEHQAHRGSQLSVALLR